jgi:hypothetical protein
MNEGSRPQAVIALNKPYALVRCLTSFPFPMSSMSTRPSLRSHHRNYRKEFEVENKQTKQQDNQLEVTIKLTDEQREQVEHATGKLVRELKLQAVEERTNPAFDLFLKIE